jgi:cell division protein FtsI/penicillin-binding protein 2
MSTNRLKTVAFFGVCFAGLLSFRLASLQIWSVETYAQQARNQHIKEKVLQANRGRILDRQGRVLATNLEAQSFFVNKVSDLDSLRSIAVRFSRRAGQDEKGILKKIRQKNSFVWLARQVMDAPMPEDLPEGVGRIVEMRRSYPMGMLAGQLIGYTDTDGVGIEGIERASDALLRGIPGELSTRVDARGNVLSALGAVNRFPEDGEDIILNIDADYQSIAEEELKAVIDQFSAKSGVAIVMAPHTGEVLAMANVPLFDPNVFAKYESWLYRNRAVTDQFEPGSTFKLIAAAAALEEKIVTPEEQIFCENGRLAVGGGQVIRDSHPSGWLTVREVIEESSNIGTIKIARKLGKVALYRYMRLFGFGARTGADLPGEVGGQMRHPAQWSERSLETMSIGQEVATTALQMASAYAAVANGGRLMTPRIFLRSQKGDSITAEGSPRPIRQILSPETAATMTSILEGVVSHGTGELAKVPGYRVAGKTGTAQQISEGKAGYDPNRYISSFIGFLPAERPELLCLVSIDSPQGVHYASQVAAPAFSRIMQRVLSLRQTPLRHRTVLAEADSVEPDSVAQFIGLSKTTALEVAERFKLMPTMEGNGEHVTGQYIDTSNSTVLLFLATEIPADSSQVPDVRGAMMRQAVAKLTAAGLRVEVSGTGKVVEQHPEPGSAIKPGDLCQVLCKRES